MGESRGRLDSQPKCSHRLKQQHVASGNGCHKQAVDQRLASRKRRCAVKSVATLCVPTHRAHTCISQSAQRHAARAVARGPKIASCCTVCEPAVTLGRCDTQRAKSEPTLFAWHSRHTTVHGSTQCSSMIRGSSAFVLLAKVPSTRVSVSRLYYRTRTLSYSYSSSSTVLSRYEYQVRAVASTVRYSVLYCRATYCVKYSLVGNTTL